jgi:hypothetical protein
MDCIEEEFLRPKGLSYRATIPLARSKDKCKGMLRSGAP